MANYSFFIIRDDGFVKSKFLDGVQRNGLARCLLVRIFERLMIGPELVNFFFLHMLIIWGLSVFVH
jgi:hypothetical protein